MGGDMRESMATGPSAGRRLAVVSPVFNDWVCANKLVARFAELSEGLPDTVIYLVNDGSTDAVELHPDTWPPGLAGVSIVHAGANLGHQRAIAIGLHAAVEHSGADIIAVIDADGEDDPAGLEALIARLDGAHGAECGIVVAQRNGRTETLSFRTFYRIYKGGFHALTGRRLDFGNFSVMPASVAQRLLHMPELWNHFPASMMRSRVPIAKVPTDRSHRYHGSSRMNFVSLVNHGLAAMAAFSDVVFARLLIVVAALSGLFAAGAVAVVGVRVFSGAAIPGWATAAMAFVLLALFQFLALLAVMTFIQLGARANIPLTPMQAAPHYTERIEQVTT